MPDELFVLWEILFGMKEILPQSSAQVRKFIEMTTARDERDSVIRPDVSPNSHKTVVNGTLKP